jgi:hypothetical protein
MALTHFAVGAALTALVLTYLVPGVRYPRLLSGLGGGWAMLPDAHWVSPVATATLRRAHDSPLADLCWFHHALDAADATDSPTVAAVALVGLLVATAIVERREYRAPAAVREAVGGRAGAEGDDD